MSFWGRGSARVTTSIRGFSHWGLSSYLDDVKTACNTFELVLVLLEIFFAIHDCNNSVEIGAKQ